MQKDKAVGLGSSILGILMIVFAQKVVVLDNLSEPGPRLFPVITGIGLIICGICVFIEDILRNRKGEAKAKVQEKQEEKKQIIRRYGINALSLIFYFVSLYLFGFIIATPFGTLAFIYALANGKKVPHLKAIILCVVVTVAIYFLFVSAFKLQLPQGLIFG